MTGRSVMGTKAFRSTEVRSANLHEHTMPGSYEQCYQIPAASGNTLDGDKLNPMAKKRNSILGFASRSSSLVCAAFVIVPAADATQKSV